MTKILRLILPPILPLAFLANLAGAALTAAWADDGIDPVVTGDGYTYEGQKTGKGPQLKAGESMTITITVPDTKLSTLFLLPHGPDLTVNGSGMTQKGKATSVFFYVLAPKAGNISVRGFDVHADDHKVFHINPLKFHVG